MNQEQPRTRARSLGSATEEELLGLVQRIDELIAGYQELRDLAANGRSRISTVGRKAYFLQCRANSLRATVDCYSPKKSIEGVIDGWGMT